MKKYSIKIFIRIISVAMLLLSTTVFASDTIKQNEDILQKIDSLIQHVPDSAKYDELAKMIETYRLKGDYVATIVIINKTLELFKDSYKDDKLVRKLNILKIYLGQSYNGLGLYSESIKHNTEVLLYSREIKDTILSVTSLMILGEAYAGLDVNDKAKKYMLEAYQEAKLYKKYDFVAITLNNLGATLIGLKEYDTAMAYFDQLELLESKIKTGSSKFTVGFVI